MRDGRPSLYEVNVGNAGSADLFGLFSDRDKRPIGCQGLLLAPKQTIGSYSESKGRIASASEDLPNKNRDMKSAIPEDTKFHLILMIYPNAKQSDDLRSPTRSCSM